MEQHVDLPLGCYSTNMRVYNFKSWVKLYVLRHDLICIEIVAFQVAFVGCHYGDVVFFVFEVLFLHPLSLVLNHEALHFYDKYWE